jgi:murein DD-endopeptidase MepM/ murein hydrolase activator NlpD
VKGKGDRIIEGTVGREPFLRAVQDAGVPKKEAYRILIAFKGVRDFDKCGSHDQFVAQLDRGSKRLLAFEYIVTKEEVYQARTGDDGLLKGRRLDLKVERTRVQGAIAMTTNSFSQAAEAGGFEPGLGDLIDEALDGHGSVDQFKKGDRLRVVAQEVTVLGEFSRYAALEALEYLARGKEQPLRIYYFKGAKARGYYDARGRAPFEGGWRKPIKGAPVTSKFNMKRRHPILKKIMPHTGTDLGAPMGTPVGASSPGTISYMGYAGASGNLVKIDHAGGYETGYAHLSRFESGLKVGDHVDRMQVIGYVGSTGRSTGPHLHFTAKKDGKYIDAESLQLDALRVLPKSERAEFSLQRAKYDKLIEAIPLPPPLGGAGDPEAAAESAEDDAADEESSTSPAAEEEAEESESAGAGSFARAGSALGLGVALPDGSRAHEEPVALGRWRGRRVAAASSRRRAPSTARAPRSAAGEGAFARDLGAARCASLAANGERKTAATGLGGLDPSAPAVCRGDVLDEREPDAAPTNLSGSLAADEPLEDPTTVFGRDTGPLVRDAHLDGAVHHPNVDADARAAGGVLERVVHQIDHGDLHGPLVELHPWQGLLE